MENENEPKSETRIRMELWEKEHGKKIADLHGEELVQCCMDVMCLTRDEAIEYMSVGYSD